MALIRVIGENKILAIKGMKDFLINSFPFIYTQFSYGISLILFHIIWHSSTTDFGNQKTQGETAAELKRRFTKEQVNNGKISAAAY